MKKPIAWLLLAMAGAMTVLSIFHQGASPSSEAPVQTSYQATAKFAPAANLKISVAKSNAKAEALLELDGDAWNQAIPTAVLLNRTPRIYQTEPIQDRPLPRCEVLAIRAGVHLYLRLHWDDATRNAPQAPPARSGKAGEPKLLYKRPTGATAAFPDAAAVMVPEGWTGPGFPSLLMGDKQSPVRLYYWSASADALVLKSSGRATPQPVGRTVRHRARHAFAGWMVALELPALPDGHPIAFALWDGQFADRDGLKFFSIWYVLSTSVP